MLTCKTVHVCGVTQLSEKYSAGKERSEKLQFDTSSTNALMKHVKINKIKLYPYFYTATSAAKRSLLVKE